jgi:ArsR family transcriptional regulator
MKSAALQLQVQPLSRFLRALGDENRLRIVALMAHGELCVCHLENALGLSQPNVSRHLAILRQAGVVKTRREGNWIYYQLADQDDGECRLLLRTLVRSFARREILRKDLERLLQCCGPGSCDS